MNNHSGLVKILLKHGVDVYAANNRGFSAVDMTKSASMLSILQAAAASAAAQSVKKSSFL